ncbi:MAG: M1 family peptidase [Bacteroidetes bacterium]|nr:MAG: M1 family peptidase [Bacteroidota bacterium]
MKFCNHTPVFLALLLIPFTGISGSGVFRQQSNIEIKAQLSDHDRTLHAEMKLEYINNSPDTLRTIYMHLWANAYKNNRTAFAMQLIENRNYDFHFASEEDRGGYSTIEFESSGQRLSWSNYRGAEDIVLLYPEQPLYPSDTVVIHIRYSLVFPHARFSRLGHHNEAFYATQWYPKPAVYDHTGWNPMSYLHRGEFYSEFGNFQLSLTLPENYIVASSGILQNEKEKAFLSQLALSTYLEGPERPDAPDLPPPSSKTTKTLHFHQENIHDFAWFADKRFRVLMDSLSLNSGETVSTFAFFTHQASLWFKVNGYLAESVKYMSEKLGPYPWSQVTAVQGITSGGADMEYPAITIIDRKTSDKELERVIVHEVFHNWFYGILASNERKEPWIDEGFATYYESRFLEEKYPDSSYWGTLSGSPVASFLGISNLNNNITPYLWYMLKAARHLDQPAGSHAEEMSELNYYTMTYFKAAMSIKYLENYLGQEEFDRIMRVFYRQWKFHHPGTADIREVFSRESSKNVSWFFDDLIGSDKKINLELRSIRKESDGYILTIRNKGQVSIPYPVAAITPGNVTETRWFDSFAGETEVFFPGQSFDSFHIDHDELLPEIQRNNNRREVSAGQGNLRLPHLQFLGRLTGYRKNNIYWVPVTGYNVNDGVMAGLAFYNYVFPVSSFEWFLMPKYSTLRDDIAGTAWAYKEFYPSSHRLHSMRAGAKVKRYGLSSGRYDRKYTQLETSLQAHINTPVSSRRISTYIDFTQFLIQRERLGFTAGQPFIFNENYYVNRLKLFHDNQSTFYPHKLSFEFLQAENMLRASFTASALIPVNAKKEGFHIRFFSGKFLLQPENPAGPDFRFSLQGTTPGRAATYDQTFMGYHQPAGTFWGNQTTQTFGGFRYPTPLGLTWNWLTAVNMAFDLPVVPLRFYWDAGTYHRAGKDIINTQQFPWVGGLQLVLFRNIVNINLPLFASNDIKEIAGLNKLDDFYQRITFSIQFERINPMEARRNFHLLLF